MTDEEFNKCIDEIIGPHIKKKKAEDLGDIEARIERQGRRIDRNAERLDHLTARVDRLEAKA